MLEKGNQNKGQKRKSISPISNKNCNPNIVNKCQIPKKHKQESLLNESFEKQSEHILRKSPWKNGVNNELCVKDSTIDLSTTKEIDIVQESNVRSPLSTVDNVQSIHFCSLDSSSSPKKRSPQKVDINLEIKLKHRENIEEICQKTTPEKFIKNNCSKQYISSPKNNTGNITVYCFPIK